MGSHNRCDYLEQMIRSLRISETDEQILKALYGSRITFISSFLVYRNLYPEHSHLVPRFVRDCWRLYSQYDAKTVDPNRDRFQEGQLAVISTKLLKSQPVKSYMRLNFLQLMKFILTKKCDSNHLLDLNYLLTYMNEIRAFCSTLSTEDKQTLRINSVKGCKDIFHDIIQDASFLSDWIITEVSKYCVTQKFSPEMTANDFLKLLQNEVSAPIALGDKASRRFLVNFLHILDKLVYDRIMHSSGLRHTFVGSNNYESFYTDNATTFQSWFSRSRQSMARLSLAADDPAECWRNINHKLHLDLATKFQMSTIKNQDESQTLMSFNSNHWYLNLSLLTKSAEQLGDLNILYGLKSLSEDHGVIRELSSLNLLISNVKGQFEHTYNNYKQNEYEDEQNLVEFLKSCKELGLLEENSGYLKKLKSSSLRDLYSLYLDSRSEKKYSNLEKFVEVERWLATWSNINDGPEVLPTADYMDLVIPTCMNLITGATIPNERQSLIDRTEWLISQDFIAQSLFRPYFINRNLQVYSILLDTLKGHANIPSDLVKTHAKNLHWNHLLYRQAYDLKLIESLRQNDDANSQNCSIDLIQLRAAKFNQKNGNLSLAEKIIEDLKSKTSSDYIRFRCSLLLVGDKISEDKKCDKFVEIGRNAKLSKLSENTIVELTSKVFRKILCIPNQKYRDEMQILSMIEGHKSTEIYRVSDNLPILSRIPARADEETAKTMLLLSRIYNARLEKLPQNDQLLNECLNLDMETLLCICRSNFMKFKSAAIDCGARILNHIATYSSRINEEVLQRFDSQSFITSCGAVWVQLKSNLISLVTYTSHLPQPWRDALTKIIKHIVQSNPSSLIYSIIVNRLELQNELDSLSAGESIPSAPESWRMLLDTPSESYPVKEPSEKLRECRRKLAFWDDLLNHMITRGDPEEKWQDIVGETEQFISEIRKISFLCGEFMKMLTIKIPRRLNNFLDYFSKYAAAKSGMMLGKCRLDECEKKLNSIRDQVMHQVGVLLTYEARVENSRATSYDKWFSQKFKARLTELRYRLNLLFTKKPLTLLSVESLIKSINELLNDCRASLLNYNHSSRQKLYMETISPMLSRLTSSLIPMPDCCSGISPDDTRPLVTIHRISQTVNMINSKTCPKKLIFIGSDGVSRSFLLKAHEDLRLDQLVMDLFGTINNLFLGNKETQNKYRIRCYSVTPVSNRSGLIQWIEAPSLCSSYRAWLDGDNGRKMISELYSSSCEVLCQKDMDPIHKNCQVPTTPQISDLYYQLLWLETFAQDASAPRPSISNTIKHRTEQHPLVIQNVVKQMMKRTPKELISDQLWYKSKNSHSYWCKTQEFIRSCAVISIVGYIIGLGDRHPENILLDYETGEVIHIDLNVCFELGKSLSIPEKVPFRLTQNIIHAFGFAGREGGFTRSCRDVLGILQNFKSMILHLLAPINLSFMIDKRIKLDEVRDLRVNNDQQYEPDKANVQKYLLGDNQAAGLDMCSQQSVDLDRFSADVDKFLTLNSSVSHSNVTKSATVAPVIPSTSSASQSAKPVKPIKSGKMQPSIDFQSNIKTPTKILVGTAYNISERIKDKLTGNDECIYAHKYKPIRTELQIQQLLSSSGEASTSSGSDTNERASDDLIVLNTSPTIGYQVDALITEASSIGNLAAMFEGWMPWV